MPETPPTVHRTHGLVLWGALMGALFVIAALGLVIGSVYAKPPPDPVAPTTPAPGRTSTPKSGLYPPVETRSFSVHPQPRWKLIERKDTSLEFTESAGDGIVFLQSDARKPAEPGVQVITEITASTQRKYPDVRTCLVPAPLELNGQTGSVFALCYTFIPQSGRAYPATDLFWVATNPRGSVFYLYEVFAPSDGFNDFNQRALELIRTVAWKLY
jgi:hypothetical protein